MNIASKLAGHAVRAIRSTAGLDVFQTWNPDPARTGKLCLSAHWDPHGIIDDYVLYYLQRIADEGYSIRLASTSHKLEPESVEKARKVCDQVIWRRNVGVDFGSWREAERSGARLAEFDELLLTNDSVFGPVHDLGPTLARMRSEPATVWGLTDNQENGPHLQSYFLNIPGSTLRSPWFRRFWNRMTPVAHKWSAIHRYEGGLSRQAVASGGAIRAAFPVAEVVALARSQGELFQYHKDLEEGRNINTTLLAWDLLVGTLKFPLIKTDVFKRDLYQSQALLFWPDVFPAESKPLVEIVIRYLKRAYPDAAALGAIGR